MKPHVRRPKSVPMPDMEGKKDLKALPLDELSELVKELGLPKFRAKQIYHWVHVKNVQSFVDMKNLGKKAIDALEEKAYLGGLQLEAESKG